MDWLSHLLNIVPVSGRVDFRCDLGAPWRVDFEAAEPGEIAYHIVLGGCAIVERPSGHGLRELGAGDILLVPSGEAHVLRDRSGAKAAPSRFRQTSAVVVVENEGRGGHLDMLCGHFRVSAAHERLLRSYLPSTFVVSASEIESGDPDHEAHRQLAGLVSLLRSEAASESLGAQAMLNALSTAMFALVMRLGSEGLDAPGNLLALAGSPRLAPALSALFNEPDRAWSLPELALLCNMSRATFVRHFQERMGRSAADVLTDIRMTIAANELRRSRASTGSIASSVGYQSEAAFQRAFKHRMGFTPAAWRRGG